MLRGELKVRVTGRKGEMVDEDSRFSREKESGCFPSKKGIDLKLFVFLCHRRDMKLLLLAGTRSKGTRRDIREDCPKVVTSRSLRARRSEGNKSRRM